MHSMALKDILLNELLPQVEKPSRYLGNELNTVHKDPATVDLRICLFFPDLYELGLGNLGVHILYAILNKMDGVWAERGYTVAPDLEALLRERGLPLFLYESKEPLTAADMIGFSLQSELTFVNVLNALDLAGVPLRSAQRGEDAPLIFAGGPAAYNPEPMASFMDFFVIGDGEEALVEMANTVRTMKGASRQEKLAALAKLPGFYVPELYPMETLPDGQILPDPSAPKIVKRVVRNLDEVDFPTDYIVPFTQLVHDGIGLEVLRGCTQGCRFCQAGMVSRPVRERSLGCIDELMQTTLENTGLDAVSLVSLSTCNYSEAVKLVHQAAERAQQCNTSVSLPSLRLDAFAVELADRVTGVRRSGLTFAPEAATPRLRSVINKYIPDDDLLNMATEAFSRGWTSIKTYFMIGLPTEEDEDVDAIADLCLRTLKRGRQITGRAMVRTGVSTFVPKPFTPFQWCRQIDREETIRRQRRLAEVFRNVRGVKFGRHAPETSFIEGLLSRADRRAADLLEAAWRNGAGFESWDERVNFAAWEKAIEETGFDVEAQFRERDLEERLPWDHIDVLVSKEWLQQGWQNAVALQHEKDCRATHCHRCGVNASEPALCKTILEKHRQARADDTLPPTLTSLTNANDKEPVQRIRCHIGRSGEARLLGHLEMQQAWVRALRRAQAPLSYSKGFHAHPKVNFATAAPLGEESEGDYMDVLLDEHMPPETFFERLASTLPRDFHLYEAAEIPLRSESLMSSVTGFTYQLHTHESAKILAQRIAALFAQSEILVDRKVKAAKEKRRRGQGKGKKIIALDIRPMIQALSVEPVGDKAIVHFTTLIYEKRPAKPKEIMQLLELDPCQTRVVKQETHFRSQ